METIATIPGSFEISLPILAFAGRTIEELVYQAWCRLDNTDRKLRLLHTVQSCCERPHVGDLACHQELQSLFRTLVLGEADQPFIHDLGAGFGSDITAQIDGQVSCHFQVVSSPGVAHRIKESHASTASNRD